MKNTKLNLLKHKLQWLVLLIALLGISQSVWGTEPWTCLKSPDVGKRATKYVGDKLNGGTELLFKYETNGGWDGSHPEYVQVRVGTDNTSSNYTSINASWEYDSGSNRGVKANIGNVVFTRSGNWYAWGCYYRDGNWGYTQGSSWTYTSTVNLTISTHPYWDVKSLPDPESPATLVTGTTATISWDPNEIYATVIIVRYAEESPTPGALSGGTEYSVGDEIGTGGIVIYKGADTSFDDEDLTTGTTYTYYLYTVNNNYYSAGTDVSADIPVPCIDGVTVAYNFELITLTSSAAATWSVEVPSGGSGYAVSGSTSTTTFKYKGTAGNDTTGKDFVFTATSASCTDTHTVKIKKDSETCP